MEGPAATPNDVLAQLDDCARNYAFPMLDNGYVYPGDVRLSAYGDGSRWALVIELLGAAPRAFEHAIHNVLYVYGNSLGRPPGTNNADFLCVTGPGEGPTFDEEYGWELHPEATTIRIRDALVPIPRDPAHFAARGIVLEEPPTINCAELLRALLPEHRERLLATEDELRERIPPDLPLILRLDEWNHPDVAGGELPSESATFRMLAEVLATGDISRYEPSEPSNAHWSCWPEGGSL